MPHTVGTGIKRQSRKLFLLPAQAWGGGGRPLCTPGACSCPCLDFSLTLPARCSCGSSPAVPSDTSHPLSVLWPVSPYPSKHPKSEECWAAGSLPRVHLVWEQELPVICLYAQPTILEDISK